MGRVNKSIEGVFVDIVGTSSEVSSYDMFIGHSSEKESSKDLTEFLDNYKDLVGKHRKEFEKLAMMEEIIMQLRSKENVSDIKLSLVREYIYARCPFYRNGKTAKDIRVIVSNVDTVGDNMNKLLKDVDFMEKAKDKLVLAMEKEIEENILNFKTYFR